MKYCFELEEFRVGYCEIEADSEDEAYEMLVDEEDNIDWDVKQFDVCRV